MHTRPRGTYHMPRSLGLRPGPRIVKLVVVGSPSQSPSQQLLGRRNSLRFETRRLLWYPFASASSQGTTTYSEYLWALTLLACTAYAGKRLRSSRSDHHGSYCTEPRDESTNEVYEMPSSRRVELENSQRCKTAELSANHGTSAWSARLGPTRRLGLASYSQ